MDGISSLTPELQQAFARASQAERKPLAAMETKKSNMQERLKLMNDVIGKVEAVKGALRPIANASAIRELSVLSSDEKAITGVVDKSLAVPGKYSFEVDRLASAAAATSNGFPDRDRTSVGSGYLTFETKTGDSQEIFIDDDHATLQGVASSINAAGLGVRASVINDQSDPDNPFRLMITGQNSGDRNSITYPEFYFVDGEQELIIETERPATNALLRYQGMDFELDTNEVKDVIPGLSLSLKGVTEPGRPTHITIEQDTKKAAIKVKDMVEKLNDVFNFIQNQNKLDEHTQTDKTLGGDYGIRMAESRLRNSISGSAFFTAEGTMRSLSELGIQFTREGTLQLDEKKFDAAIGADYERVVDFLCGDGVSTGLVNRLNRTLSTISGSSEALLQSQKKTQSEGVRKLDGDIKDREKKIKDKEETLKQKLARANTALEALKGQGMAFAASEGASPALFK